MSKAALKRRNKRVRHNDIILWIVAFKLWMGFCYILVPLLGSLLSWLAIEGAKSAAIDTVSSRIKPIIERILARAKEIRQKQKDKGFVMAAIESMKVELSQLLSILDREKNIIANSKTGKAIIGVVNKIKAAFNKVKNFKIKKDSRATTGRTVTKAQIRIILGLPPNANVGQEWMGRKMSGIIIVQNKNDARQQYSMPEEQVNSLLLRQKVSKGYTNPYTRLRGFDYGFGPASQSAEFKINSNNKASFVNSVNSLSEVLNTLTDITNTLTSVKHGTKNAVMSAKLASAGIKQATGIISSISRGMKAAGREIIL